MNRLKGFFAAGLLAATAFNSANAAFVGDRSDFRDETIYFAITTRFYDGDPKNNVLCWDGVQNQVQNNDPAWRGDFAGLIEKLDYIKALGFTAIWITPIVQNASGFDYHGYHAMDFSKVDLRYESRKEWGSAKDVKFEDLIKAAHDKDIKIILDIVLQHTGNFGEDKLCKLFDRSQQIRNQANIEAALIPTDILGGKEYWNLPNEGSKTQYSERFKYLKNTDGQNHDTNNYWHHVSNAWDWDVPSRWWGQIAGDCVDLNTENPAVVDYIVSCYENFIKMGVDGFRIDTTGHIAPLTFNSAFIPRFVELGEKYKSARKGDAPFYMFGECCARYGSVVYRDQHLLSSHYYTWKSPDALVKEWKQYDAAWWAKQVVPEGAAPLGNMLTCEKDPATVHNSKNVFMQNGAWHEPDYSQASGFNVIDFPMHYNFNNAGQAVNIAKQGDHFYNDASWNVVYVDSHDYSPGPNDGIRFPGGTAQWAENLSLMFTFRGIPCLYYGSEVEFQKGKTIDEGPGLALVNSGRAYFGEYLKGKVEAEDFGKFTAEGNVAKTLNADLAQHIIRLNQIRAAVPALRKGQYTFDGCSAKGGFAFKRAYKDSYALVAINGGATFSNVPAGTYTDIITGQTYTGGGSITVNAPSNQGQLRVLVKDWKGTSKTVGVDGKFIYNTKAVSHGGAVTFADPGTTEYYTAADAIGDPAVKLTPGSSSFKTETLSVSASLSEEAASGWYKIGSQAQVNISKGQTKTFTVGAGMQYGESVTVTWGAKDAAGKEFTGKAAYKKVDPNAVVTIYVTAPSAPHAYIWGEDASGNKIEPNGAWPGNVLDDTVEIDGKTFYSITVDAIESVNVIFNNGNAQTGDITGITEDTFFEYNGGDSAKKLDNININAPKVPGVSFSPNGGTFFGKIDVTVSARNATSAWYKIGNGAQKNFTTTANFTLGDNMAEGESVTVTWSATNGKDTKTGSVTYTKIAKPNNYVAYFDNSESRWDNVYVYTWTGEEKHHGAWPGKKVTETAVIGGKTYHVATLNDFTPQTMIIFHNNAGTQTSDMPFIHEGVYTSSGQHGVIAGIDAVGNDADAEVEYYNLQGVRVADPAPGIYIRRQGRNVSKVIIR